MGILRWRIAGARVVHREDAEELEFASEYCLRTCRRRGFVCGRPLLTNAYLTQWRNGADEFVMAVILSLPKDRLVSTQGVNAINVVQKTLPQVKENSHSQLRDDGPDESTHVI